MVRAIVTVLLTVMAFLLTVANIYIPWAIVLSALYHLIQSWG